ncbi:MAG TPA: hypothetical protein VKB17_03475 [Thermoleophilaceae bacterium]|nr:hypothetical protein [Thermoleophilaceae bacterium]
MNVLVGGEGVQLLARDGALHDVPCAGQDLHHPARVGAGNEGVVVAALLLGDGIGQGRRHAVVERDLADELRADPLVGRLGLGGRHHTGC